jgi:5-methylcytosine-specific restriction protein A
MDRFYQSAAWRALRLQCLIRDKFRCVVCGRSVRGKGNARVDHIKPRSTHPHLALVLSNIRALCPEHDNQGHSEKGAKTGAGKRIERFVIKGCDVDGWPLDPMRR